jgi:hypothetical protein
MGLCATINVHTKFHKVWFRHSKVNREEQTHRDEGDLIGLLLFFLNKESRLKNMVLQML